MASSKIKQGLGSLGDKIDKVISNDQLIDIEVNSLQPFPDHPFQLYSENKMQQLQKSIEENGILSPIIIMRDETSGAMVVISGHNRIEAAKRLDMIKVPCVIKDVDYETAAIMMVDTNFNQRDEILPSEKAFAYKIKLEAMTRKAGRPKNNSSHSASNKRSDELLGEQEGESKDTVRRYIRLTNLVPLLLQRVDEGSLGFIPAVDISYLSEEEQNFVEEIIEIGGIKPTKAQANELKKRSQEGKLSQTDIKNILTQEKLKSFRSWKIDSERFSEFLPKNIRNNMSAKRADEIFEEAMTDWLNKQNQ